MSSGGGGGGGGGGGMRLSTDATVKGVQVTDRLYGLGNWRVLPHHFHIQISVGDIIMRWKYHTCCNSFPF